VSAWSVEERARERRSREKVLFPRKQAGDLRVCLVYPNRYAVGMGNLGFHAVYEIFDRHPSVVCERAFLPDDDELAQVQRGDLRSLETFARVQNFDIVAFSISFETDYWHVARLLDLIGVPLVASERNGHPLVIAGGPAVFLNPEPLANLIDVFLIGEAEEMLPEFLDVVVDVGLADRDTLLRETAVRVRGAYTPSHYEPVYEGPHTREFHNIGPGPDTIERRLIWDLNRYPTATRIISDEAVFGDMMLVEASRGCQWGCRFCAAGYMYRPIRTRGTETLQTTVAQALGERQTIGLIGAEMASVPGVDILSEMAASAGGRLSPSSLKADCVTPRLAQALRAGRNRSVTIAPEAGSERLRQVINKNLTENDILRAADLLVGEGVPDLKLYFMVGLPTEQDVDIDAIVDLTSRLRERLGSAGKDRSRISRITVSVNPFVPKPWTPFQWEPMRPIPELKSKFARLRRLMSRIPNTALEVASPRDGFFQTLLSRGDRRISHFLRAVHEADGDRWGVIRKWQRTGLGDLPPPEAYVHREYSEDERFPWDFIDHRIKKSYLWVERRKAMQSRQTPPCDTTTCVTCAAC